MLAVSTVKTFAQTLRMMALSKELVEQDDIATKREAYYVSKNWEECRFLEQVESDTVMDDVEALFELNREQLGFIPEEKGGEVAGRLFILDKMVEVLPTARETMSDFAPRIITIKINPEKIREIIGKGGSMIRKIQEETSTEINVEDDGTVEIAAISGENSRKAIQWIESLTREVEVGALYLGKVTRIMGFGAFVEILPGKEGLVRIGELADYHVPTVEDVVSVGDEVMVVVTEIDRQGRVNLSRKAAMQRHLAKEPV